MEYQNFPEKNPGDRPEEGPSVELPKQNRFSWVRNFFVFIVLAVVIAGSFMISFQLGKKVLFSVKKQPFMERDAGRLEPPPSYEALRKLEKALRAESKKIAPKKSVRKAAPARRYQRTPAAKKTGSYYKVQVGPFATLSEAKYHLSLIRARGIDAFLKKYGATWKIQAGAYKSLKMAKQQQKALLGKEFKSKIIIE
ncbi:MAG: SPOR domain-containing protein [Candidatus Margulisiibacteriota bacterium]|jgi:hypothetical protein